MERLDPLGDQIVVRRAEQEAMSPGGIHLPETAKRKSTRGEVVAVGPGDHSKTIKTTDIDGTELTMLHTVAVRPGDVVVFSAYAGTEVECGDEKLLVMREGDVLAVVRD